MLCFCLYVTKVFICFFGTVIYQFILQAQLCYVRNEMGSVVDVNGSDCATLAFKGSQCWVLFCRTSLKHSNGVHIACSYIGWCVLLSV
jgi:hypothetical protein